MGVELLGRIRDSWAGRDQWSRQRILLVLTIGGSAWFCVGAALKLLGPYAGQWRSFCYSDVIWLYPVRGLAGGLAPLLDKQPAGIPAVEYPTLTILMISLAVVIVPVGSLTAFYVVTSAMLLGCFVVTVRATALTAGRTWDGAMVAFAPSVLLVGTLNWDLLAVAAASGALWAWSRRYPGWAGVLIAVGASAKLYPLLLMIPLAVLCVRAGRVDAWLRAAGAFSITWLVVNVPFMVTNFDVWAHVFRFNQGRGPDAGSIWYGIRLLGLRPPSVWLTNLLSTGSLVILLAGMCFLALSIRTRPRLASLCFLAVAAVAVTSKVYSPQYVLWLIPLAVLARPRIRDFLIWQLFEVGYYFAVFAHDGHLVTNLRIYELAIFLQVAATLWFSALVIRDMLVPNGDSVRAGSGGDPMYDPGGGVLDRCPDKIRFGLWPLSLHSQSAGPSRLA